MLQGIIYALTACLIWGLIFVVPQFMTGFSAIEVAFGRYIVYSAISLVFFSKSFLQKRCRYPSWVWKKALVFSLASTMGYYTFLVLSLRYASAAITALILGVSPIVIALYGNWKQKEIAFRSLIFPSLLILLGLVIINVPHLRAHEAPSSYLLGLIFSVCALILWCWYVVANARFLCQHTSIKPDEWSTLIGMSSLIWVVVFVILTSLFFGQLLHTDKYFVWSEELKRFWMGSAILGLLCSWLGAFLWNQASLRLPISFAGQLTIFETIFGVIFVYCIHRQLPSFLESLGMAVLLSAIVYGIRLFSKSSTATSPTH